MASKHFEGTLVEPIGDSASNDKLRFTHTSTTGQTIGGAQSVVKIDLNGDYSFDLEYGIIQVEYYSETANRWRVAGSVIVNSDTTVTTITGLLNAMTPTTPAIVLELQQILADAEQAAADTQQAANDAAQSAVEAAASAVLSAENAAENGEVIKSLLIAQGLSGNYGFFADGFTYNLVGDVGIDVDGKIYTYAGGDPLPVTVAAGTNPVGDSDYKLWNLDSFNVRDMGIADIISEDAPVGTRYRATDLDNARYDVVASSDEGGFYYATMVSGRKLRLVNGFVVKMSHTGIGLLPPSEQGEKIQALFNSLSDRFVVDMRGYEVSTENPVNMSKAGSMLVGGEWNYSNEADQFSLCLTLKDNCTVEGTHFKGDGRVGTAGVSIVHGAVFSGSSSYIGVMQQTPANDCNVTSCKFEGFTHCVFINAQIGVDNIASGWSVTSNTVLSAVGTAGNSEGYGVLFSPCNESIAELNRFYNIKRHALYIAADSTGNELLTNKIYSCDNSAIHVFAFDTQNGCRRNRVAYNTVKNVTRNTGDAGAITAIGTFVGGNSFDNTVEYNNYENIEQTGVYFNASASSLGGNHSRSNEFKGDGFVDSCIRDDNVNGSSHTYNKIRPNILNRGFTLVGSNANVSKNPYVRKNTIYSETGVGVGISCNYSSDLVMNVSDNEIYGIDTITNEIQNSGTGRLFAKGANINQYAGFYGSDANYEYFSSGITSADADFVRLGSTLTANRNIYLNGDYGAQGKVTFRKTITDGFVFNIFTRKAGADGFLVSVASGESKTFIQKVDGGWEIAQ